MSQYGPAATPTQLKTNDAGSSFVVKNTTKRLLNILGIKIGPGNSADLLSYPGISEDDIKVSLLKGELKARLLQQQITVVSSTGNLYSGTNPNLAVTAWFIDPQNSTGLAKDSNSGIDSSHPLLTLAALASRLGGTTPDFGNQSFVTVVTLMSDTNASDPFNFRPVTGTMVVSATLIAQVTGAFSSVTARVVASATRWSVATSSFNSWVPYVGMLVSDNTTPGFFFVDVDLNGGSAQISQPLATGVQNSYASNTPLQVTPGQTDSFTVYRLGIVHVTVAGSFNTVGGVIFQNANLTSPIGGTLPASQGQIVFYGAVMCQHCSVSSYLVGSTGVYSDIGGINGRSYFTNCYITKGGTFTDPVIIGGVLYSPFVVRARQFNSFLDGGLYLEGASIPAALTGGGRHALGDVGVFVTTLSFGGAGQPGGRVTQTSISVGLILASNYTAKLWGTSALSIKSLSWLIYKNTMALDVVTTGAITLCGLTTGSSFDPTTGAFSAQTAVGPLSPTSNGQIDGTNGGRVLAPANGAGIIKEV